MSSLVFGIEKIWDPGVRAKLSDPNQIILVIFFFWVEKIAIFVTLKKISHLDFHCSLKKKYRKCQVKKSLVLPEFFYSYLCQSFLHISGYFVLLTSNAYQ